MSSQKPNSPLQGYPSAGYASPQTLEALWDWVGEFLSGYEAGQPQEIEDVSNIQNPSVDPPMQDGGRMGVGIRLVAGQPQEIEDASNTQDPSVDPPIQDGGRMGVGIRLVDYSDSESETER